MKIFTLIIILTALFHLSLQADETKNPSILYKSGAYSPINNIKDFDISKFMQYKWQSASNDTRIYVLLQFAELPSINDFSRIAKRIDLLEYIPNNAYFAAMPLNVSIEELVEMKIVAVDSIRVINKISPVLTQELPDWIIQEDGKIEVLLQYFRNIEVEPAIEMIKKLGLIQEHSEEFCSIRLIIDKEKITHLASLPFIMWIEEGIEPQVAENLPGLSNHRARFLQAPVSTGGRSLSGQGVRIGIWDGGNIGSHVDFIGRLTQVENTSYSSHATHCLGTTGGAGNKNPRVRGMSPKSLLYSWNFNGSVITEASLGIANHQINISTNSYGSSTVSSPYNSNARSLDILMRSNDTFSHIHSAGNSGPNYNTITASSNAKSAKNNIVIGALSNLDVIASFSSRGPTNDGRIKPEVSAVGVSVYSCSNNHSYATSSGTSMATPGVAGTISLIYERYKQLNANANPNSSLIRNLIANTADDLGNPGPDFTYGFGRINARKAVLALEDSRYFSDTVSQDDTRNHQVINVPANTLRLKVMLTYLDKEGASNASPSLVNDLNLSLIDSNNSIFTPLVLDPSNPADDAAQGIDSINNIEQIVIDNPQQGNYTISVNGFSVPFGPQEYFVSWEIIQPEIQIVYPIGGEKFIPGTSEIIRWDASGITSNQTLEISTNGGTNWNTISSTIASDRFYYTWTPQQSNVSGDVKFRISSGTMSSVSNDPVSILPTTTIGGYYIDTTGFNINYSAINGAASYRIFVISNDEFIPIGTTNSTFFNVAGLTAGNSYWFAVCGVHSNGIEGERSIAEELYHPYTFSINGNIALSHGTSYVGIQVTNGIDTIFVDSTGNFSFDVSTGNYTIRPISVFHTFIPDTINVAVTNLSVSGQTFMAKETPNVNIGSGTNYNTNTSYPAPYGNYYYGARHQMLILSNELTANGLAAGDTLKALAFDIVASNNAQAHQNFRISLKNAANTTLTSTITGMTEVLSPNNYLPVNGWNIHTFSNSFVWDGSNLVVETCFQNSNYVSNASTRYTSISGFVPTRYINADNSTVCGTNTSTSSQNRPNMRFIINDKITVATPQLVSPANNSANNIITPILYWNISANAINYRLQVADNASFAAPVIDETAPATSKVLSGLAHNAEYYWRVRGMNAIDTSDWSNVWKFTTQPSSITQTIPLTSGWNMISAYVAPQNTAMNNILSPLSNNMMLVRNAYGQIFAPHLINTLSNWNTSHAYQMRMNLSANLILSGTQIIPEHSPIVLNHIGWYWLPYYRTSSMPVANALSTISGKYLQIKNISGQVYHPPFIYTLQNLLPNHGYMIRTLQNATLNYPPNAIIKSAEQIIDIPNPNVFVRSNSITGKNAVILLELGKLQDGDEVGVFTRDGMLVGSGVWANGSRGVVVWGDDEYTIQKDGASEGEELIIKVWSAKANNIGKIENISLKDMANNYSKHTLTYQTDAIYFLKGTAEFSDDKSLSVSPQPASNELYVKFNETDIENANVRLYNQAGQIAFESNISSNSNILNMNTTQLADGVYLLVIIINEKIYTEKVVIMK